ncbi:hypothetical protein PR003_g19251 [Phytophthora rubi]|uniref:Transmembrane protein n=1 Tax=Phytophthora rubi TaxID=129364 RepID=A0A6A4E9L5_9STRA|nr:hypothetical protein PR002_g18748 [Phytophthora rubi]KAE9002360.1 hypothetical protein PR001_g18272 [Phytophthora rubi]KAE9314414.1 hypothetical protein PR003_g19251 [Phytophthora rubi]
MALHRKQRGVVDAQYVRIRTSSASGRAVGYSLHEAHPRAQRVYAKRYAAGDRSRKISSLQLRACFLLCVLLYFGAIYFADDIASIGRVVGSEQDSQNFFVHSLRPRGRGHVRVGRAVDAKRADAVASAAPVGEQQQQDDPPTEAPEVESQSPAVEATATAEMEEAQATQPLQQPDMETEGKTMHQDEQTTLDNARGDDVHPDDQGGDGPEPSHREGSTMDDHEEQATTPSTIRVEPSREINHAQELEQGETKATPAPTQHAEKDEPQPTAAVRLPEKDAVLPVDPVLPVDAVPAASPARGERHHVQMNVEDHLELPKRQAKPDRKPSEHPLAIDGHEQPSPVDRQQQREEVEGRHEPAATANEQHETSSGQHELTAADGQHGAVDGLQEEQISETTQPAETPAQMIEHISDI